MLLPLMFLPQLLGLAFGIPAHGLGLKPEILEEVFER